MNPSDKKSEDSTRKSVRKKSKTRLRKTDHSVNLDIPGIKRIVLNKKTQEELECAIGKQMTFQYPWKFVPKELIEDSITFNENSEFLPLKTDIAAYVRNKLLLGFSPDDDKDYDEFYLCLTEEAEDAVHSVINRMKKEHEAAIIFAQYKSPGMWVSLGSELVIKEYTDKTNRNLLEVEIETAYPILSPKARFKMRTSEEAKDGYEELLTLPDRLPFQVIRKMRTDKVVQVTPPVLSQSSQTDFTFPKNAWTQYLFEYKEFEELSENFVQNFASFTSENLEEISNHLQVNYNLNFYVNDYANLITDLQYTVTPEEIRWDEYMSFADLQDARNKMVSSVSWHPMWSGTVAIAYANLAPNVCRRGRQTIDEVSAIIHEANPVLIWGFSDGLKPKLYLESHTQVECISFCPFNANIIVGASKNGQVIIWDIHNKLEKVEEIEILTTAQQKYRFMMRSLMNWMRNTPDVSHVRATAESDLIFSHATAATGILWIPSYMRMTSLGKYELVEKDKSSSLQFATCALDGTILFWDLLAQSEGVTPIEHQPRKHLRRFKGQPSALMLDVSPFTSLNKVLRPFYKLSLFSSLETSRPYLLSSLAPYVMNINYKNPSAKRKYSESERVVYKPIITTPPSAPPPEIYCGSYDGYMLKATWQGYDSELDEIISPEKCVLVSVGKFHDGPVVCIEKHPLLSDTYLTIGGKVFAIWKDAFKDKPVFWRKSRFMYTHGEWDKLSTLVRLCRSDGNREIWNFLKRSNKIYHEQDVSGNMILGCYLHTLSQADVLGISDYNGTFRVFYLPANNGNREEESASFNNLLDREVARKQVFIKWQDGWFKKNAHIIQEKEERIRVERQMQLEREKSERKRRKQEQLLIEKERRRLAALQEKPPPGEYFKWTAEKWKKSEHERMYLGLLLKKRLNPEELAEQQIPLKELEQAEENKKKKRVETLQKTGKIFNKTVGMVFPEFFKEKPPPPLNPYGGGDALEHKQECVGEYEAITEEASQFVKNNPFVYEFNWKRIIHQRRDRRKESEGRRKTRRERATH